LNFVNDKYIDTNLNISNFNVSKRKVLFSYLIVNVYIYQYTSFSIYQRLACLEEN